MGEVVIVVQEVDAVVEVRGFTELERDTMSGWRDGDVCTRNDRGEGPYKRELS